jgi:hypothetical protein
MRTTSCVPSIGGARHEVGDGGGALGGADGGLEHHGAGQVAARDAAPCVHLPLTWRAHRPVAVAVSPSRLANMAAESKRGRHSHSMSPSRCTSAALWVEPISA